MSGCEIPEPDYDDPKELYAFFGLAFYKAQVLEQGVVNLAVALNAQGKERVTTGDVLDLYEKYERKTFGNVLRAAQQLISFPPSLEDDLEKALNYRNHLAHAFFVEHSEDALHEDGRRRMIDELRTILEFINRVDEEFDAVWMSAWHALGITEEWFERKFKEIEQIRNRKQAAA